MVHGYSRYKRGWQVASKLQGKSISFGRHRTELEACTAAIQAFKQHGPPELQAFLCQEPQPITPQPPVAAPISLDPCSPDTASAEDRPLLRRFLQATRDPRMMSHVQTGAPAYDTEHHKQQQRLSAVQQPDIPAQKAVGEQCSIAKPSFKPTLDGRYRLPPRLRKTAGSGWIRGYRARKVQAAQPFFVYEVDISFTADGQSRRITGGGKTALEADAAGLAVEQFRLKGLGQVRSVQEAEQDPDWQHELQQLRSAGHYLPAPVQPQPEPQYAQHAFQASADRGQQKPLLRTDHGPRLPKPAKRKAPVSQSQPPISSTLGDAQLHDVSEHSPRQPPKKPNRAPFAAAACMPAIGSRYTVQSSPEDDDMQYPGEPTPQAVAAPGQLQPPLTAQLPVPTQPKVPLIPQLPVDPTLQAGSFEAESTAPPKTVEPSSGAQLSARQALPARSHAGPSCAAVLEALNEQQRGMLHLFTARMGPPAQELERCTRSLLDIAGVLCPGEDPQLLAKELIRQQFPLYSAAQHAGLATFLAAAVHPR